jgi:hypothetical protein
VAQRAIGWEPGGRMRRIVGAVVISLMAAIASGRECCVIVVGMALRAGDRDVRSSQRKLRRAMVKGRGAPAARRMAKGTVGGKSRRRKVRLMARIAIGGS